MMNEYDYDIRFAENKWQGTGGPTKAVFYPDRREIRDSQLDSLVALHDAPHGSDADNERIRRTAEYVRGCWECLNF